MNEETNFHPPSASASGDNAYYLQGCDTVGRSPAYASCLFKLDELKAGRRHEIYRDCHAAIEARQCKAVGMREEEQLKGQAIYFLPRRPPLPLTLSQSVAGDFGVRITNLTPPHLIPKELKSVGRINASAARDKPYVPQQPDTLDEVLMEATTNGFAQILTSLVSDVTSEEECADMALSIKKPANPASAFVVKPTTVAAAQPAARPAMMAGETPLQYARRLAAAR